MKRPQPQSALLRETTHDYESLPFGSRFGVVGRTLGPFIKFVATLFRPERLLPLQTGWGGSAPHCNQGYSRRRGSFARRRIPPEVNGPKDPTPWDGEEGGSNPRPFLSFSAAIFRSL
ncbi:Hypothetical protein NTJ_03410 [Nesidiocoris tenuis]|uniref:Uncharacterized protein n=1 Tax=Nesidiocoris tenuis TaxID=355587 RepID=A0ABN7AH47_9HEMI|nr:Hypothetical protein NTJ_03410 [Nesidiocoris tenuis]